MDRLCTRLKYGGAWIYLHRGVILVSLRHPAFARSSCVDANTRLGSRPLLRTKQARCRCGSLLENRASRYCCVFPPSYGFCGCSYALLSARKICESACFRIRVFAGPDALYLPHPANDASVQPCKADSSAMFHTPEPFSPDNVARWLRLVHTGTHFSVPQHCRSERSRQVPCGARCIS